MMTELGMPKIAVAILRLPNGQVVLQRKDENSPRSPHKLALFGGSIEANETPKEAIVRELIEETSLPIGGLGLKNILTCIVQVNDKARPKVKAYVFEVEVENNQFSVYEGKGAETYSMQELLERDDVDPTISKIIEILEARWH
jgi:mutator protein MutT